VLFRSMLIAANQESKDPNAGVVEKLDDVIAVAIESLKILIEQDRRAAGK
jgi:hypothetical protein